MEPTLPKFFCFELKNFQLCKSREAKAKSMQCDRLAERDASHDGFCLSGTTHCSIASRPSCGSLEIGS